LHFPHPLPCGEAKTAPAVIPLRTSTCPGMQTDSDPSSLVAEVNELNFEAEVLKHQGPVLADFSTAWCGPCRALSPIVHELSRERAGALKVVAIDGDAAPNLTARYGVRGFPTVILFRSGEEVARRLGLTTKKKLLEMIGEVLVR
jgi:thioredoxin 1